MVDMQVLTLDQRRTAAQETCNLLPNDSLDFVVVCTIVKLKRLAIERHGFAERLASWETMTPEGSGGAGRTVCSLFPAGSSNLR